MRVSANTDLLDLAPGSQADLTLDIVNNGSVIEGITARVIGLPDHHVVSHPAMLPLFPDASGQMTLNIGLPSSFPAGRHPLTVEVHSRDEHITPSYVDLDLVVPRQPAFRLTPTPRTLRSRRTGRFTLAVINDGNTPLDVTLRATDTERLVDVRFSPETARIPAGITLDVTVVVKGPRMMLGSDTDRQITVEATGRPLGLGTPLLTPTPDLSPPRDPFLDPQVPVRRFRHSADPEDLLEVAAEETVTSSAPLIFRQRPWFTRGILTALILLSIIAVWAAVFLFGISSVFSKDPLTKTLPPSFFAGAPAEPGTPTPIANEVGPDGVAVVGAGAGAGAEGEAEAASAAPAGSMPKEGAMPAGLGGTLSGTVTAASNGEPVGRILVEAYRQNRDGGWDVAASAATQADGTYSVAGLIPTTYAVKFSAEGFVPMFYSVGTTPADAAPAEARAGEITPRIDVVIVGNPASITGTIDPGDTLDPVVTDVSVRALLGSGLGDVLKSVKATSEGAYTLPDLPAPNTYELTFTAEGYLPTTSTVGVDGGTQRINPEVLLGSGLGVISGIVTDGTAPIGGVTVTTTVDGEELATGTPTTGEVGRFVLGDLPTPATYVLTFTADGYAPSTRVVGLGPGAIENELEFRLTGGTGTVTGRLVGVDGVGLGGAVVTVGGAEDAPSTITVTSGDVGAFQLTGLVSPGSYTLTFTLPGFADQTVPVVLTADVPPAPISVVMATSMGGITGTVVDADGDPVIGASVIASDGIRLFPVFSTAAVEGTPAGGFTIADLPAGVYTVTATRVVPEGETAVGVTAVITVAPGTAPEQLFELPADDTSGAG